MAIWIGNVNSEYTAPANWDTANVPNSAGETATFTSTGPTSVTISGGGFVTPGGFTFDANAQAYTIALSGAGTILQFQGAGIVNNSAEAQNLSTGTGTSIQFVNSATAGNATITINSVDFLQFLHTSSGGTSRIIGNGGTVSLETSSGTLSIGSLEGSGTVFASAGAGGAATHILTVGSLDSSTTFSGVLRDTTGVTAAALGLTKVGSGTLTLSGASTYTLATTVSAGTLQAGATNTFSDDSAYSVASGATLALNGFSQIIGSLTGVAGASVTLGSGILTAGGAGNTTYAGDMSGTGGGLSKVGAGRLTLSGTVSYTGATSVNTGTLALTGTTSLANSSGVAANGTFDISGITGTETSIKGLSGGGSVVLGAKDLVITNALSIFSGAITGTGDVVLQAGQQVLSGNNTYTGATTINGGTLQIDGSLTASATTVNAGGTLAGSGTVQSVTVNSGGHVAPGSGIESLATGNFTLNAGASLDIEIAFDGLGSGPISDQLIVTGTVTLGGKLTSRIIDSAYHPATGTAFTIIDNDGTADAVNGTFASLIEGEFFTHNGSSYSISYVGGDGNDVVLTAANDAPVTTLAGDLDALVANTLSGNVSVLIGNGTGGFTAATPVGTGSGPVSVALGDVNGDGNLDALVANTNDNNVSVLIGNGTGGFTAATPVGTGSAPVSVALGDINGDGNLDALAANALDNNVSVLLGNGAGGFTAASPVGAGARPESVALGDVDGDGDLDALVANRFSNNVSVLIGNGAGGFTAAATVGAGVSPISVALGDVNGDGHLDALVANVGSDNVSVLIGNGTGGFTAATAVVAGANPFSVALGDVNGDGNLDALVANQVSDNVSVLIGNGTGGFTAATPVGTGSGPVSVALGDVNGDGNLDALVANQVSDNVSVLIGNGAGGFTAVTPVGVGSTPASVALGDVNNAQVTAEDTAFNFSVAGGNAITLFDRENSNLPVDETVTLEVEHGILTLATLAGLINVTGNGTGTVTFTGTLAEINAALNGLSYTPDDNFNGADTITITANDNAGAAVGGPKTAAKLIPIIVNAVAVAQDDSFATDEDDILNGVASVFANNGSGADSDAEGDDFDVTAVNGVGASVGTQITLASGATLTLNADGTFSYDPNGAFDALPAPGSGASNATTDTDTFTYTVTGGDTATVTVTINGVDSDGDNLLGTVGADTLNGGIGPDTMAGGASNDTYLVDDANDAITEGAGDGVLDRVYASTSYGLAAGVGIEWMATSNSLATTPIDLTGNELANRIYGNAGDNTLSGGGGNDILLGVGGNDNLNGGSDDDKLYGGSGQNDMAGGTGNDWYIVDSLTDVIIEAAGEGTRDRVWTALNYTLSAGAHVEILSTTTTNAAAINLTGNELANTIYGNNNVNVLGGAAGNDVLAGQGGIDTLNGGDGDDRLLGGAANDTVNGGNGNDILLGEAGDDNLNGGSGNDRLLGGAGQNDLAGGAGNDTYIVSSTTDTVAEGAGGGTTDRVYSSVNFALAAAAQIEFLATGNIAGTTAINLTGNAFANTIYGNNGANVLSGKAGNDVLAGRGGPDIFVFDTVPNSISNRDIVADFNGVQDNIRLVKSAFSALTGAAGTTLSADQFVVGAAALDANDRVIYNNGTLNYDSNGNLAGGVQVIAFLSGKPALSNTDILLG